MCKTFSSVLKAPIKRILYKLSSYLVTDYEEISILIGVSGGQDSTCLSMFLLIYQKMVETKKQIRIGLVHCQHNWNFSSLEMSNH